MRPRQSYTYEPPNQAVALFLGCVHPSRIEEEEHDLDIDVRGIGLDAALGVALDSLRDEEGGTAAWLWA